MSNSKAPDQARETGVTPARPLQRRVPNRKSIPTRLALSMRLAVLALRTAYLRQVLGMNIHPDTQISLKAHLDSANPRGIHIGEGTLVAFGAVILSHDMSRALSTDTYIGRNCFIGAHSIILPGIRVGDGCIVATGSVVTKDVEANTIVAGNPARVVKTDIRTMKFGVLEEAYREALTLQLASDIAEKRR
jgi:acetyltransferase-like isoleucine patch superfamily enzyme